MIPVVFSALAMRSVGKAAMEMVNEVRRQFRDSWNYGELENQNTLNVWQYQLKPHLKK